MTDWSDPLVIATFGLVTVTAGLFVATAFYAKYTKRQVALLESQERVQIAQNKVLRANVLMTKLITEARENADKIVQEMEKVEVEQPTHTGKLPEAKLLSIPRAVVVFGGACFSIALLLFGLQFINHYFESVINQKYATYTDWLESVVIAGFFGGLMIGSLILVFPYDVLERVRRIRRGKKQFGL